MLRKKEATYNTVRKIWKQFFETGSMRYESHAAGSKQLQQDDLDFIRFLKTSRAYRYVNEFCNVASRTSNAAINGRFEITGGMEDGLGRDSHSLLQRNLALKKINVHYCLNNYIYTVDPYNLNFFDESGIKLPDVGKSNYASCRMLLFFVTCTCSAQFVID